MRLHADVAHPINSACRERIQQAVIEAYQEEIERSKQPGYKPPRLDEDDYEDGDFDNFIAELKEDARQRSEDRGRGQRSAEQRAVARNEPQDQEQEQEQDQEQEQEQAVPTKPASGGADDFAAGIE